MSLNKRYIDDANRLRAALAENAELKRTQSMILKCSSQWQHDYVNAMIELTDQKEANRALELQRDAFRDALSKKIGKEHQGQWTGCPDCDIANLLSRTDTYWREIAQEKGK